MFCSLFGNNLALIPCTILSYQEKSTNWEKYGNCTFTTLDLGNNQLIQEAN